MNSLKFASLSLRARATPLHLRQHKMTKGQGYNRPYIPHSVLTHWRPIAIALSITSSLFLFMTVFRTPTGEQCLDVDSTEISSLIPLKHSTVNDPYLRPGTLTSRVGTGDSVIPFWDPFDPSLPRPPHLLEAVIEREPLSWLLHKTLVIIGDSVDRYLTQFFCELTDSDYRRANMTDLDSPVERDDLTFKTSPVICRVDYYDFEIISFSHFGMQNDSEDYWSFKKGYTNPGIMDKRIPLIGPLCEKHNRQPDMVIMGSGILR